MNSSFQSKDYLGFKKGLDTFGGKAGKGTASGGSQPYVADPPRLKRTLQHDAANNGIHQYGVLSPDDGGGGDGGGGGGKTAIGERNTTEAKVSSASLMLKNDDHPTTSTTSRLLVKKVEEEDKQEKIYTNGKEEGDEVNGVRVIILGGSNNTKAKVWSIKLRNAEHRPLHSLLL